MSLEKTQKDYKEKQNNHKKKQNDYKETQNDNKDTLKDKKVMQNNHRCKAATETQRDTKRP